MRWYFVIVSACWLTLAPLATHARPTTTPMTPELLAADSLFAVVARIAQRNHDSVEFDVLLRTKEGTKPVGQMTLQREGAVLKVVIQSFRYSVNLISGSTLKETFSKVTYTGTENGLHFIFDDEQNELTFIPTADPRQEHFAAILRTIASICRVTC